MLFLTQPVQHNSSGEVQIFIDVSARRKRGKCMGSTLSGMSRGLS